MDPSIHLRHGRSIEKTALANHEMLVFEGPYEKLVEFAASLKVGMKVTPQPESNGGGGIDLGGGGVSLHALELGGNHTVDTPAHVSGDKVELPALLTAGTADTGSDDGYGYLRIASVKVEQGVGGSGRLVVLLTQNAHACVIAMDFCEVSKNILTWTPDNGNAPDLGKIAAWRANETADPKSYAEFKVDGTKLDGNTLKLAEKIMNGVECYTVHLPMVTCTATLDEAPDLVRYPLGVIGAPATPNGWTDVRGRTMDEVLGALKDELKWLRTVARATPNADGSYNFVTAWQGATMIDTDLYGGDSSATPSTPSQGGSDA